MSAQGFFQMLVLAVALGATVVPLGRYMAKVYGTGEAAGPAPAPGDRLFLPVEKGVYRLLGVDSEREQRWNVYALSLLAFSLFSILLTYLLLSLQGLLPLNPTEMTGVGEFGAFNAAIIRGLLRRQSRTLGNFWVDLVRGTLRILLPISLVGAVAFVSLGVTQNLRGGLVADTVDGAVTAPVAEADGSTTDAPVAEQTVPGGPVASQLAIGDLGTNGGGFYNANAAHPFENPNGMSNLLGAYLLMLIPFAGASELRGV